MEDQFGGRTDDDLFYDDFEPVESEAVLIQEQQYYPPEPEPVPQPASIPAQASAPAPAAPAPVPALTQQVASQPASAPRQSQTPPSSKPSPAPAATKSKKPLGPSKGLSSSRFADKPAPKPSPSPAPAPAKAPTQASKPQAAPKPAPAPAATEPSAQTSEETIEQTHTPPNATTGAKEKPQRSPPSQNTAVSAEIRAKSGSNPRQKLTEDELTAKMEKMKLLSAEKARKFEMAEQDEKQHAAAYARGMEEARKRRAEEAERRKRGEEERRKLDDERAKNRERKLKAMTIKDGSWDEGKEALAEEEARRGFRGANGGIRGTKTRGLGGSRFARDDEPLDVDRFLDDRHRGGRGRGDRGRGANGNGRGRGRGRGSYDGPVGDSRPVKQQQIPAADDFPSLPSDNAKSKAEPEKNDSAPSKPTMAQAAAAPPPPLPIVLGGKWDDEMEALDELNQAQS
ncbi:hypothetical protein V8C35DRAFT_309887 [Trichoderma chlorosporum]